MRELPNICYNSGTLAFNWFFAVKNRLNAKVPELKQILGSSRIQEIVAAEVFPNTWREKNVNCARENSNIRVGALDTVNSRYISRYLSWSGYSLASSLTFFFGLESCCFQKLSAKVAIALIWTKTYISHSYRERQLLQLIESCCYTGFRKKETPTLKLLLLLSIRTKTGILSIVHARGSRGKSNFELEKCDLRVVWAHEASWFRRKWELGRQLPPINYSGRLPYLRMLAANYSTSTADKQHGNSIYVCVRR